MQVYFRFGTKRTDWGVGDILRAGRFDRRVYVRTHIHDPSLKRCKAKEYLITDIFQTTAYESQGIAMMTNQQFFIKKRRKFDWIGAQPTRVK